MFLTSIVIADDSKTTGPPKYDKTELSVVSEKKEAN